MNGIIKLSALILCQGRQFCLKGFKNALLSDFFLRKERATTKYCPMHHNLLIGYLKEIFFTCQIIKSTTFVYLSFNFFEQT